MDIGIVADNTFPLHIPTFIKFFSSHAKSIRLCEILTPLRIRSVAIEYERERRLLNKTFLAEGAKYAETIIITTIPFENNYFYVGRDKLMILSFSDWNHLTAIPMTNGL